MPPKTTREKRTAFCPVFIHKIYPQKLQPIEPELRKPFSQAIPQFQHVSAVLLAPPSDPFGIYEVWGSTASLSAPPLDPFGITGYGALGGGWKYYTDLSIAETGATRQKDKLDLS